MSPNTSTNKEVPATGVPIPPALADVALVDAETCASAGSMSVSWWQEEVRAGRAPKPVVQRPRCTRWRVVDVRDFWARFAEFGPDQVKASDAMKANMTRASAKARLKQATKTVTEKSGNEQTL